MRPLDIYRKTLGSLDEADTAWWYLGTTTAQAEGHPELIVNHVETVMIYRTATLGPDSFRVPWWEIGLFRDATTGELPDQWTNPITGVTASHPRTFEEGPSGFSLRATDDGIAMFDAVQAFAALDSATIDVATIGNRVCITQTEVKTRAFPGLDGIPGLDSGQASQSRTVLQWLADADAVASGAPSVPATGAYSFEIGAPVWLGFGDMPCRFMVKGLMVKADLAPPLNPRGWQDLQALFPHYFDNGVIQPRWL